MTHRQYSRFRKWDLATRPAYNAAWVDGMDSFFRGEDRPPDPDEGYSAPFDLTFQWRSAKRVEQMLRNHEIARERGRLDGWEWGSETQRKADKDDYIETQVAEFAAELDRWPTVRKAA